MFYSGPDPVDERIWKEKATHCESCRNDRCNVKVKKKWKIIQELEQGQTLKPPLPKEKQRYTDVFPGLKSKNFKKPVDVMLILQTPAPSKELFEKRNVEDTLNYMKEYWYGTARRTFHSKAIKEILKGLTEKEISWFLTDIVKCFVYTQGDGGKSNFLQALDKCLTYLNYQLEEYKPKIIVLFGGNVYSDSFCNRYKIKKDSRGITKLHCKNEKITLLVNGKPFETLLIFSIFPSKNTADYWIEYNEDESSENKLLEEILKRYEENNLHVH